VKRVRGRKENERGRSVKSLKTAENGDFSQLSFGVSCTHPPPISPSATVKTTEAAVATAILVSWLVRIFLTSYKQNSHDAPWSTNAQIKLFSEVA